MGVTNLWTILAPVKQHKPLSSLRGQTIAVDLSIWVCENQCVKSMQGVVARPYLRNLFFRVSYLTQLGVKLVFVIEGVAPQLKWQEMSRRQQALGRGRGGRAGRGGRSNFNARLRECCQLLDLLGIPYIHSRGEAEAMCAALNAAGLVDACITDDGDVFLYGARTVYKNFTMNNKDPHVESYSMNAIEQDLGISRESLVGVALLLGCDYLPGGVPGVGVDRVIKYLQSLKGVDILKRFLQWNQMAVSQCVSKIEIFIRQKSLATQDFPQTQVIDEFLSPQETIPKQAFIWRRPQISKTQEYAETKMEWPPDYTTEKVLPLVTLWDQVHIADGTLKNVPHLKPCRIVKPRVRHGVPVYEVEWFKPVDDEKTSSEFYTTMEEQGLFARAFPSLVLQHEEEMNMKREKKKKGSKRSKKKEHPEDELGDLSSQMLLLELQEDKDAIQQTQMTTTEGIHKASSHMSPPNIHKQVAESLQTTSHHLKEHSSEGPIGGPRPTAKSRRKPSRSIKDVEELAVRVTQASKPCLKMNRNSHCLSDRPGKELDARSKKVSGLKVAKLHKGTSLEFRGTLEHRSGRDVRDQDDSEIPYKSGSSEDSDKLESDSESDKENDEVFLSLSQRLQMKLGQSIKGRSSSGGFEQCLALKQNTKKKCMSESGGNSFWSVKPVRTRKQEKIVVDPNIAEAVHDDSCFKKPQLSYNSGKKSDVMIQSQEWKKKTNEITDLSQTVLSRDQPMNGFAHNLVSDLRDVSSSKPSRPYFERKSCDSLRHISLPVDSTDSILKDSKVEGQDLDSLAGTRPLTYLSRVLRSDVETSESSNIQLPCPRVNNSPAVSDFTADTLCSEHDFSHVAYMTEVHTPDINSRPSKPVSGTSPASCTRPLTYLSRVLRSDVETSESSNIQLPCPRVNNSPAVSDFTADTLCSEHDFSHVAYMTEVHTPDINSRPSKPVSGTSPASCDLLSSEKTAINHDYLNFNNSSATHNNINANTHVPGDGNSASQISTSSSNTQLLNKLPHKSKVSPEPVNPSCVKSYLFNQTPSPMTRAERPTLYPQTPGTGSPSGEANVLLYQTPSPLFSVKPCIPDSVNSRPAPMNQTILYQTPSPASTSAVNSTLQFGNFSMQASLLNDTSTNATANSTYLGSSFVSYRTPVGGSLGEGRHACSPLNNVDADEVSPVMPSSDSSCLPPHGGSESTTCDGRYDINFSLRMLSLDSKPSNISKREDVASRGQLRKRSSESSTSHENGKNKIDLDSLEHDAYTCSVKHPTIANGSCETESSAESVSGTSAEQNTSSEIMFPGRTETDERILNLNRLSSQSQIPPHSQKPVPNRSKLSLRRKGNRSQSSQIQHEVVSYDLGQSHPTHPVSTTGRLGDLCTGEQPAGPNSVKCSAEYSVIDLWEDSDSESENVENPHGDAKPVCVPTNRLVSTDKVSPKSLEGDRTFLQMLDDPSRRVKVSAKQPLPNFYEDSDSDTVPDWETETKGAETLLRAKDYEVNCSEDSRVSGASSISSEEDSSEGMSRVLTRAESCVDGMIRRGGFVARSDSHDVGGVDEMTLTESPVSLSDRLKLRLSCNAQNALKALSTRRTFGLDVNVKPIRKM